MKANKATRSRERGATMVIVAGAMVALIAMAALSIDVGHMFVVRRDLQRAADAAALAAVYEIPTPANVVPTAQSYSVDNHPGHGTLVQSSDVSIGHWDSGTDTFTAGGVPANAVEVTAHRSASLGNPVQHWFAPVIGLNESDISATGIAVRTVGTTRFLIDDEMIDSDVDSIYNGLCGGNSSCADDLISDNGDSDVFIQLSNQYAGTELWLPTGQGDPSSGGDPGLIDIDVSGCPFPFPDGTYTFNDFMLHEVFSPIIPDSRLDPLNCVDPVYISDYSAFVDPSFIHVSPVYKSDISADSPGTYRVNAKGERRGLIAFSIVDWRPPGNLPQSMSSSSLPEIKIRIQPPQDISALAAVGEGSVRLVKG
ncbi:MAG: hypothetical protein HKN24_14610 [Acidimicrobiales bacterium]|nr:hypothetical protein [Acidimicrobiales bacterium]